jgi:hypothetical protein
MHEARFGSAMGLRRRKRTAMMVLSFLQRSARMDAMTAQTAVTHSHIVRPKNMEWQQTRFPGCEAGGSPQPQFCAIVRIADL